MHRNPLSYSRSVAIERGYFRGRVGTLAAPEGDATTTILVAVMCRDGRRVLATTAIAKTALRRIDRFAGDPVEVS